MYVNTSVLFIQVKSTLKDQQRYSQRTLYIYLWGKHFRGLFPTQYRYNNFTTLPHMGVDPTHWNPPHMRECCEVIVPVLYKYHFPTFYCLHGAHSAAYIYI
jgi:hypothetical protein